MNDTVRVDSMAAPLEDQAQKVTREIRRTGVEVKRVRNMVMVYPTSGEFDCANTPDGYARLHTQYVTNHTTVKPEVKS